MKSKKNTEFEILLQEITEKTGLSYTEISRKVGRNDGYIAQIKSRIKNNLDEVPDKFMELLKLHFANWNEAAEPQAAYNPCFTAPTCINIMYGYTNTLLF